LSVDVVVVPHVAAAVVVPPVAVAVAPAAVCGNIFNSIIFHVHVASIYIIICVCNGSHLWCKSVGL